VVRQRVLVPPFRGSNPCTPAMYMTYVLQSIKTGEYYIGQTENICDRLIQHNDGLNRSTKYARPWKLAHCEEFETRSEAIKRERYLKSLKSRKALQKLFRV
jgi:putative endonuclease